MHCSSSFDTSTGISELTTMSFYSLSSTESDFQVNDQLVATSTHLTKLRREQKYFIQMIDSLNRTDNLNPKEAKVQLKHLNQFYQRFIYNQSKIVALVGDASLGDQVEISQKVQQKVRQIETKLEEIISSNMAILPLTSTTSTSVVPLIRQQGSSVDVEARVRSLGSRNYLNRTFERLINDENDIYKEILQNIEHPPQVAGSIHLRPWVDNKYRCFVFLRNSYEDDVRQSLYNGDLGKLEEIYERVERAVEDYRLYCEGRIPKQNLNYISSMMRVRGQAFLEW